MAHWRNTFKPARFFIIDARASFFLLLFLVHIRPWTFVLLVSVFSALYFVERLGYDFQAALRAIRVYFAGNIRPANSRNKQRFPVDFGRIHFKK